MARGVRKGQYSKRDILRSWIDEHGDEPIDLAAAKAQYDALTGADPKWTGAEVMRILEETHDPAGRGKAVWVRRYPAAFAEDAGPSEWEDAPAGDCDECECGDDAHGFPEPSAAARLALGSWYHPLLVEALATLNAVRGAEPGDPAFACVDFGNPAWMALYEAATATAGERVGPLDMVSFIAAILAEEK